MRRPGIEPGASRWQRDILPLNQRRSVRTHSTHFHIRTRHSAAHKQRTTRTHTRHLSCTCPRPRQTKCCDHATTRNPAASAAARICAISVSIPPTQRHLHAHLRRTTSANGIQYHEWSPRPRTRKTALGMLCTRLQISQCVWCE